MPTIDDFFMNTRDELYALATGEDIFDGLERGDLTPKELEMISDTAVTSYSWEDR